MSVNRELGNPDACRSILRDKDLKVLVTMIELSEMGEPKITSANLQDAVGLWDQPGKREEYYMGWKVKPSGFKAFDSSIGRLVAMGLIEQTQMPKYPGQVAWQLPNRK